MATLFLAVLPYGGPWRNGRFASPYTALESAELTSGDMDLVEAL